MKRFLVLCVSLLLIVSLMAMPALAVSDGGFVYTPGDGCVPSDFIPESGKLYTGRICTDIASLGICEEWYDLEPFEINVNFDGQDYSFDGSAYFTVDNQRFCVEFGFENTHDELVVDVLYIDSESEGNTVTYFELFPYEPEPVSADELTDNVGSFFSGVAGWVSDLASLLQEPLVLLTVLCIPLSGVIIWAITKFKDL